MPNASRRDDFLTKTKLVIAQRVNYLCSNPSCHEFTSGPHSDDNKPLILGIAAHICAAAPNGPRYDPAQTQEERASASNGIWLCNRHAREIDADAARFPSSLLRNWRDQTEAFVAGNNPSPSLPNISFRTLQGLRLIPGRTLTSTNTDDFRDHELTVENTSRLDMRNIELRIQCPIDLFEFATIEHQPAECNIGVRAPRLTLETVPVDGQPGIPWNIVKPTQPHMAKCDVMHVHVSSLPALSRLAMTLVSPRTSRKSPSREEALENNSMRLYRYNITARFAFDWNREVRHLNTWTHLAFDADKLQIASGPTLPETPPGKHALVGSALLG